MKSHEKFMKSHYMKLHEVTWEKCKKSKKLLEKCEKTMSNGEKSKKK